MSAQATRLLWLFKAFTLRLLEFGWRLQHGVKSVDLKVSLKHALG